MDWLQVSIMTTQEGLDLIGYHLEELELTQYELVEDAVCTQRFLDENAQYWDYIDANEVLASREPCVRVYLTDNDLGREQLQQVRGMAVGLAHVEGLDMGSLEVRVVTVCEEDWANSWKQYYKPMEIGERLLIKPSWEELENQTQRIILQMDPGMVFGTGTHETTQLCLSELDARVGTGMKVLDLGCGSGILSLAALLLGAQSAIGVDIDPNAVDIAYNNADGNNISRDRYTVIAGNVLDDAGFVETLGNDYDIVVANIVAGVIVPLTAIVPRLIKKGGIYITSGIISERAQEVTDALLQNGFTLLYVRQRKDWLAIVATMGQADS